MKTIVLVFLCVFSSVVFSAGEMSPKRKPASNGGADPCSFLDKVQCNQAGYYCAYLPAKTTQPSCVAQPTATKGQAYQCQSAYTDYLRNKNLDLFEKICSGVLSNCEFIPSETLSEGCYMRDSILNKLRK